MTRRIVFLRHGVTDHNASGLWQGHLDTPLNDLGLVQADDVAPVMAAYSPSTIVTSDLSRALVTARVVAAACAVPLRVDARLREIDVGAWQGRDAAAIDVAFPGDRARIAAGEDLRRGGHGESVADLVRRARPAVEELLGSLGAGECAVVVTHGVAARALVADICGMDQRTAWLALLGLGNCHFAEVAQSPTGWRLALWNGRAGAVGVPVKTAHGY